MKDIINKVEAIVKNLILPAIVILIVIVILQFFFFEIYMKYELFFRILEFNIVILFIVDLYFKYTHVSKFKEFVKLYWLDIIVIFPFFLIVTTFERVFLKSTEFVVHSLNLGEEVQFLVKDSEKGLDSMRRFNKVWPKLIRILKIVHYR